MRLYASIYMLAYVLLLTTLFVLPFFSFEGYSLAQHTMSELGAQKVPGNWWANGTIILLSVATVILATKQLKLYWKPLVALYFFCATFFCTAIYQLAGFNTDTYIFNYTHDAYHSLFSILTGFAFCLFCILFFFILKQKRHKWQTLAAFLLALITPILMLQHPEYRGVYQRILFLGCFGWLFFSLATYPFKIKNIDISSGWKYYK